MSELQIIESALKRAATRRRWARALRGSCFGLLIGAALSLILFGVYHLRELPTWALICAAVIPFPCMLVGLVAGMWRRTPLHEVARWVDGRQHLQERLSTALEVSAEKESSTWRQLVMSDAADHVKALDPRRLVQFSLPKVT